MSKINIAVAAFAALMLSTATGSMALTDVTVPEPLHFAQEPIVLHIAEGEQVYCADAGLKKVGEDEYVFTIEETPENAGLCITDVLTVVW